jgi:hypothetical protein
MAIFRAFFIKKCGILGLFRSFPDIHSFEFLVLFSGCGPSRLGGIIPGSPSGQAREPGLGGRALSRWRGADRSAHGPPKNAPQRGADPAATRGRSLGDPRVPLLGNCIELPDTPAGAGQGARQPAPFWADPGPFFSPQNVELKYFYGNELRKHGFWVTKRP